MLETSARLLRLLSLLQLHRDWTGPALAERLGVSTRTIRTDMERLRTLGYPVHATPGVAGGYRLGAGSALPPLLLDDDEAVAVAVGLATAANGAVTGIEETSVRALVKLQQVLPARLRHRVAALTSATVHAPDIGRATVDAAVLTAVAAAIRAGERLRFDYEAHAGAPSRREVEPHRLVHWRGRWYLFAWDPDRDDWRTFRVDRIVPKTPNGARFSPRPVSEADIAERVRRGVGAATWRYRATVRMAAPAAEMRAKLPPAVAVEPDGPDHCVVQVGSDSPRLLAFYLGSADVDFEVLDGPELAEHLLAIAERFRRAADSE
ncbi:putative DNA-binding transcriptional regulator YafY [Nocardia tenerifensis]|uniref:Putative DNA-binding transcriptional regulator YafY n=3 Tax=Nocardia tenerifensis TaxID=228006 RepID=A0A318JV37_9NOCA|nr:YafY family protein [Nocardia tenerifensis]PXX59323.1 putative DNA-binding transcriptional regulator YafY [Nocardia tenerifensis]